ncbi:pyridoxal phosphate phosphatase PHOSPHO2-like [Amphibalanus amphitrite]|nr:pyridoxal phosphate phosphatase PHOSPHO2-like [Amphibalanus amphitrite]
MRKSSVGKSKPGGSKTKKHATAEKHTDVSLLVMDFDHTIVDDNTDTYVWRLGEDGKVPESITGARDKLWTHLMQDVFDYLFELGRTPVDILNCVASMKLAPGMDTMLFSVPENIDIIIISDSNSVFIQHILETHGLYDRIMNIFTNPANFDQDGRLVVTPFTDQETCGICERNLCKGDALKLHLDRMTGARRKYDRVLYVGDGKNDVCPCLKLGKNDVIFARAGYRLEEELKKMQDNNKKIDAEVVIWHDANVIFEHI